ncbi:hypothetical protein [Verrucomicrobium spinosum]|uniref:hypothetical protein n=1 Tax=Verrucomicrobium spinosum TaxID=2736 RepID=UPI000946842B|nr:hypothetical protein [Verrucomicrobium spinosum]
MPPSRLLWGGLFAALLLGSAALPLQSATAPPPPTKIAFVGVWDRSMALVDAACREQGLAAVFARAGEFGRSTEAENPETFPLVMVLNLEPPNLPA